MNPALLAQYEAIGRLMIDAKSSFALRWHDVGVRVRSVMLDPSAYGTGAVAALARALGKKPGVLYDAAKVAAVWSRDELECLLARPNAFQLTLTFSHLVLLAEAGELRHELTELALSHGWTVRALRRELSERQSSNRPVLAPERLPQPLLHTGQADQPAEEGQAGQLARDARKIIQALGSLDPERARDELRELQALHSELSAVLGHQDTAPG